MAVTYADVTLINTTYGISHAFDEDTTGAGTVETLRINPSYSGSLEPLLDGGSVRYGGEPQATEVSLGGVITGDSSNKASDTIKSIQQVLHDGALKIRFPNATSGKINELTDCIVSSFTYAPVQGGGTDVMSFDMSIVSGAKYFTETDLTSASQSTSGSTTQGSISLTGFESEVPTRPIITITRDGASTVDTSFRFRAVNHNQTTTPEFRIVTAKMGVDDVLVVDPFLEQVYIKTNNSGVAEVPTRVDGPVFHVHTLLGATVPQVQHQNTTGHTGFTIKVEWYTYRLCFTQD